jgi:hypothetical protein
MKHTTTVISFSPSARCVPSSPRMLRTAYGLLLQKQSQEMERSRLAEASRTDRERAVSALLEEAKGNDQAKALLQQFVSALATKP